MHGLSSTWQSLQCHRRAGGVVLVILAAIDGGYSGDWSRIGLITQVLKQPACACYTTSKAIVMAMSCMAVQDQEAVIRQLLGLLGLAHLAFAAVAAKAASDKGLPLLPSVAKVQALVCSWQRSIARL